MMSFETHTKITIDGDTVNTLGDICQACFIHMGLNRKCFEEFDEMHWAKLGLDTNQAEKMNKFLVRVFEHAIETDG